MKNALPRLLIVCATAFLRCAAIADTAAAQGMTISPTNPTIDVGAMQQFTTSDVSTAAAVSAGGYHTCILLQNGELRCMGRNDRLQLFQSGGDSRRPLPMRPTFANDPIPVTSVSAGGFHSCIVMSDHTVQCWGDNTLGQDGNPYTATPQGPQTVNGITTAIAVAAGYQHSCALLQDGRVQCWGDNTYGQLGNGAAIPPGTQRGGDSTQHSTEPVDVVGINSAVAITAAHGFHSCAVLQDGTVKCWGDNVSGQLGDGSRNGTSTPVTVQGITNAVSVSAGDFHTCALLQDGTASCWGSNGSGQLGDGTGRDSDTPVMVSGISNAVSVDAGVAHNCAALADGTARCWGANRWSQIGDETPSAYNVYAPGVVYGISSALSVTAGHDHSCAVLAGGLVRCWGLNTYGRLGDGRTGGPDSNSIPTLVVDISPTYGSSDRTVATVDEKGLATGWAQGSTTITAGFDFIADPANPRGPKEHRTGTTTLSVNNPNPQSTLTVQMLGAGTGRVTSADSSITCETPTTSCSASYPNGTTVTLTAAAGTGSMFTGWHSCDSTSNYTTCNVTVNGMRWVWGGFYLRRYTLWVPVTPFGGGTVTVRSENSSQTMGCDRATCSAEWNYGSQLVLTAKPNDGWTFVGWPAECESVSGLTCRLTITTGTTVRAQFAPVAPAFSVPGGTYSQPQSVALSTTTPGATMHYTTDGSTPTSASATYTGPISITQTTTLKAIATASGMFDSDVSSATFTLQAAAPAFDPPSGSYRHPQRVSISDASPGTTIYYTTDGTTPTTASPQYDGPFMVFGTTTIKAIAVAAGWSQSEVADSAYTITAGLPGQTPLFNAHKDYPAGYSPVSIAIGDMNGDSVPDLVTANGSDKTVAVLLGSGDGTFQPPRVVPLGSYNSPRSVAIGDFNRDGKPDLVVNVASDSPVNVSVLLGNGDGTFQAARTFGVGYQPFAVAADDFNGDGMPDLAVTARGSITGGFPGTVAVLLGNGDGTFQAAQNFRVGRDPDSVAVADFNRDGKPDLAVANGDSQSVSVLLGNGDGTFQAAQNAYPGVTPGSVAVGDFNGDGVPDLAVANVSYFRVSVLLGNGDGTFQAKRDYPAVGAWAVAVGDFNGDGTLDLAVSSGRDYFLHNVSVLLGNGDGTFQAARTFGAGSASFSVVVGDFNGDGVQDLAAANSSSTTVSVLLGNGDGTFPATPAFAVGINPESVAVGDFNRDDRLDLAVANAGSNTVSVLMGNGDGTFQAEQTHDAGAGPTSVAVGDFNRDGNLDLVVANYGSNDYHAVTVATTVSVLLGNGDGTFGAAQTFEAGSGPNAVVVGEFNGDGIQDLAVADYGPDGQRGTTVSVLLGYGDGTFKTAQAFEAGNGASSVAVGDFNRDGVQDLAVSNANDNTVSVLLGNGDGTFQAARRFGVGAFPWFVVVGDFNGDQVPDLAVSDHLDDAVSVLLGNGDGSFQPPLTFATGWNPAGIAVGDFNADGNQDLAVANGFSTTVSVLAGRGDGTFLAAESFGVGNAPASVAVGDFNGDGMPDLGVANYSGHWSSSSVSVLINP